MTEDEDQRPPTVRDPLAEWRHLPAPPRPEDLIASHPVTPPRGAAEPAGDTDTEFMLRYAG